MITPNYGDVQLAVIRMKATELLAMVDAVVLTEFANDSVNLSPEIQLTFSLSKFLRERPLLDTLRE